MTDTKTLPRYTDESYVSDGVRHGEHVECPTGEWVKASDVEALERAHADLKAAVGRVRRSLRNAREHINAECYNDALSSLSEADAGLAGLSPAAPAEECPDCGGRGCPECGTQPWNAQQRRAAMSVQVTKEMVDRFLSWRLPEDFYPDAGISFDRANIEKWGMPIGTNLFTATQARAMLEHVLDAAPVEPKVETAQGGVTQVRAALLEYLKAQRRMRDRWADGDDAVKQGLWRDLHACEAAAEAALATPPAQAGEREEAKLVAWLTAQSESSMRAYEAFHDPADKEDAEMFTAAARALRSPILAGVPEGMVALSQTDAAMTIGLLSNLYDAEDHGCEDYPPGNECGVCGVARLEKRLKAALADAAQRAGREG